MSGAAVTLNGVIGLITKVRDMKEGDHFLVSKVEGIIDVQDVDDFKLLPQSTGPKAPKYRATGRLKLRSSTKGKKESDCQPQVLLVDESTKKENCQPKVLCVDESTEEYSTDSDIEVIAVKKPAPKEEVDIKTEKSSVAIQENFDDVEVLEDEPYSQMQSDFARM